MELEGIDGCYGNNFVKKALITEGALYRAGARIGAPISIIRQYIERQRNPQSDSYRANAPRRISPA